MHIYMSYYMMLNVIYVVMFFPHTIPVTTRNMEFSRDPVVSGFSPNLRHGVHPASIWRLQAQKKLQAANCSFPVFLVEPTPSEKYYCSQIGFIFPLNRGENKNWLKPPPSFVFGCCFWLVWVCCICAFLRISGLICWLVGSVGISPPWYSWHWVHLGSIVGTTNLIYCSKIRSCTFQFCPKSISSNQISETKYLWVHQICPWD